MAKTPPGRQPGPSNRSDSRRRAEPAADSHDTPFDGAATLGPPSDPADTASRDASGGSPGQSAATLDEAPLDSPAARTHPSGSDGTRRSSSGSDGSASSGPGSGAYFALGSSTGEQRLFPDWERFEILDFLGAGGMGSVFKARDPRLGRLVAIKFMRVGQTHGLETRHRQRFQREAQAQARLDHPNICKIYEVGEVQGQPYIVMQYIDGKPLSAAHHGMSREQKIQMVCQITEALHTAHRLGLIHRDIKPGNVMIERTADGQLWPYVMDFGLARQVEAESSVSSAGVIEGTPSFMSPEQARGEVRRLDRRTDIYSLGATLYDILLGHPPFEGATQMEILLDVLLRDPTAPHELDPSLPADLETILLKCLEKEPHRRYESARALADDLHHFLDGEPISARPPSLLYRLGKSLRRNRMLVAIVGTALVMTLVLGGLALRARIGAAEQAAVAQQLGQDLKEIELFMRYAYGLPLHDISREQALIRARMTKLEIRLRRASWQEAAALHYAIGRGHLVLREYDQARSELEQAWQGGYRTPAVSFAYGSALAEIYHVGYEQARRSGDEHWIAGRTHELEEQYLKPALKLMDGIDRSQVSTDSPAYIEGLLAYYSKDLTKALPLALRAHQVAPWLAEPLRLAGDVYREQTINKIERGDYKLARAAILAAAEHHRAAADIARSDSELHETEARDWIRIMEIDDATGSATDELFERTRLACDRAIQANPRSASAHSVKAWAYWRWGIGQWQRGQSPTATLGEAIAAAEKALQLDPHDHYSHYSIGVANYVLGAYAKDRDPEQARFHTERAIVSYEQAIENVAGMAWYWSDLGASYTLLIELQAQSGRALSETLQKASAALVRAIALDKGYGAAYGNLTALYLSYGQNMLDHGENPSGYLDKASQYGRDALAINANDFEALNAQVGVHLLKATYLLSSEAGDAALAEVREGRQLLTRSLHSNSNNVQVHQLSAELSILEAMARRRQGQPVEDALERGLLATADANRLSDQEARTYLLIARLRLIGARAAAEAASREGLAQAEQAASRALALHAQSAAAHELLAQVQWHALALEVARKRARPAQAAVQIEAALQHCSQALRLQPQRASTTATLGALHLLTAKLSRGEARREAAGRAAAALGEALKQNRLLSSEYAALLHEAEALSAAPGR